MNRYGPSPLRSCPELWSVANSSSKPNCWKNFADFPQLWVSRKIASTPLVAISLLLLTRRRFGAEVRPQRLGHQRRQRHLRFDRPVFDLLDQLDREIHVELLDFLGTHQRTLTC